MNDGFCPKAAAAYGLVREDLTKYIEIMEGKLFNLTSKTGETMKNCQVVARCIFLPQIADRFIYLCITLHMDNLTCHAQAVIDQRSGNDEYSHSYLERFDKEVVTFGKDLDRFERRAIHSKPSDELSPGSVKLIEGQVDVLKHQTKPAPSIEILSTPHQDNNAQQITDKRDIKMYQSLVNASENFMRRNLNLINQYSLERVKNIPLTPGNNNIHLKSIGKIVNSPQVGSKSIRSAQIKSSKLKESTKGVQESVAESVAFNEDKSMLYFSLIMGRYRRFERFDSRILFMISLVLLSTVSLFVFGWRKFAFQTQAYLDIKYRIRSLDLNTWWLWSFTVINKQMVFSRAMLEGIYREDTFSKWVPKNLTEDAERKIAEVMFDGGMSPYYYLYWAEISNLTLLSESARAELLPPSKKYPFYLFDLEEQARTGKILWYEISLSYQG